METLNLYFNHRLTQLGYGDDMEIRYNLSYCQGDGMAWYGTICDHDVLIGRFIKSREATQTSVAQRLRVRRLKGALERHIALLKQWSNEEVEIAMIGNDRYHHYNSMRVESEALEASELIELISEDAADDDDEATDTHGITHDASVWDSYISWLQDDVEAISHILEREGYNICEAIVAEPRTVWERSTPNYVVTVELDGDDGGLSHWDEGLALDTLSDLAQGNGCMYGLVAWVECRHSGQLLGRTSLGGIHSTQSLQDVDGRAEGYLAEKVYESIETAKKAIQKAAYAQAA
tara:strand:- start:2811 stop:3683 length:873 start_codon:yes stop_codon:yes gene_type:complete